MITKSSQREGWHIDDFLVEENNLIDPFTTSKPEYDKWAGYNMPTLQYYKIHPEAPSPVFGTQESACFDIFAYFQPGDEITTYDDLNGKGVIKVSAGLYLEHGKRALVPTGLIFDIPSGYSVRIHPRSGVALKQGIIIGNLEGVIDSDYYHQTYLMLTTFARSVVIHSGERLAQGELVKSLMYNMKSTLEQPQQRTDRIGGLGSTGLGSISPGVNISSIPDQSHMVNGNQKG